MIKINFWNSIQRLESNLDKKYSDSGICSTGNCVPSVHNCIIRNVAYQREFNSYHYFILVSGNIVKSLATLFNILLVYWAILILKIPVNIISNLFKNPTLILSKIFQNKIFEEVLQFCIRIFGIILLWVIHYLIK